MKRLLLSLSLLLSPFTCHLSPVTCMAQSSARQFTVNITPDGKANMVAYLPERPSGRAIVDCPGGGYSHLAVDHEGHQWAQWFNDQGIAFFVLTYRMPGGDGTIPVGDAQQAIRTVRDSAAVWGINPGDVGIMGFSAGGHLASTVSTHSEADCRPNFSILFYPVISMDEKETHKGSCVNFLGAEGQKDEQLVKEFSNYNAVNSDTPPAIILTASDDRVVPVLTNSIPYYTAMRKVGNECTIHIYPSGGHGFGFRDTWPFHNQMLCDLSLWLKTLHPSPVTLHPSCVPSVASEQSSSAPVTSHPWQGKRVAYFGDSITDPRNKAAKKKFWGFLSDWLGTESYVYAVSGRQWNDIPRQTDQLKKEHGQDVDAIVVFCGTNDYNSAVPLGQWWEEKETEVMYGHGRPKAMDKRRQRTPSMDANTYRGRINIALDSLKRTFPTKQIVLLTPIHRSNFHANEKNWQCDESYTNRCGEYLDAYVEAVKEAGNIWSVPVIDWNATSGLFPLLDAHAPYFNNADTDRLHPNDLGHERLARTLYYQLLTLPCVFQ